MKLLRVFPRKTNATPDDMLTWIGFPGFFIPDADRAHVSCTFTYDKKVSIRMAEYWNKIMPTELGGPAFDDQGGEFVPGRYMKQGNVITSRGCGKHCWFCYVTKREGEIRELPIVDGYKVHDNNLLACSEQHIDAVFSMLKRQRQRAELVGGLDPERITASISKKLLDVNPRRMYFAYDTESDKEPIADAMSTMKACGHNPSKSHSISCFVLIGYPKDTFQKAEERLRFVMSLDAMPFAMLYRDDGGQINTEWRRFQRTWCRPIIVGSRLKEK